MTRVGAQGGRSGLTLVATALVLLVALFVALTAAPASAAVSAAVVRTEAVDCGPASGKSDCNKVEPVFECVWDNRDGTWTASFGYDNTSGNDLLIPVSRRNEFSPAPADRGQPLTFAAGQVANAFVLTWGGGALSWRLGNGSVSASSAGTRCAAKPVSVVGGVGGVAVFGALVLGTATVVLLRRRRSATSVAGATS